jgi:hypothetical protein
MTGFRPDDYVMTPYSEPVDYVISSRKNGKLTKFRDPYVPNDNEMFIEQEARWIAEDKFYYDFLCKQNQKDLEPEERIRVLKNMVELKNTIPQSEERLRNTYGLTQEEVNAYVDAEQKRVAEENKYTDDELLQHIDERVIGPEETDDLAL